MHNKFAIIDSLVLINGSFNVFLIKKNFFFLLFLKWTMQAATKNQENVTIIESKFYYK